MFKLYQAPEIPTSIANCGALASGTLIPVRGAECASPTECQNVIESLMASKLLPLGTNFAVVDRSSAHFITFTAPGATDRRAFEIDVTTPDGSAIESFSQVAGEAYTEMMDRPSYVVEFGAKHFSSMGWRLEGDRNQYIGWGAGAKEPQSDFTGV